MTSFSAIFQQYPQLNEPHVSRRALLAASSILALNLVGCGSGDDAPATSGTGGTGNVVTTLAGSATSGFVNGPRLSASFNGPTGVAVDGSGNVYVADRNNNMIRKIDSAGIVSTLAGSATSGFANGPGLSASFNGPTGVAVDGSGNVYIADSGNHLIRKITSAGVVSTVASGTPVSFAGPTGVAVDASGNVYVADHFYNMIRKITSAGVVSTLAGSATSGSNDGTGPSASFSRPTGVAVDGSGNVYVADRNNNMIRKITSAGVVSTLAGSTTSGSNDGTGPSASFLYPYGVAVDGSGNVYIADSDNHMIRKIV